MRVVLSQVPGFPPLIMHWLPHRKGQGRKLRAVRLCVFHVKTVAGACVRTGKDDGGEEDR